VALLHIESVAADAAEPAGAQPLAERLSRPAAPLPPLRITWSRLTKGPPGELWGCGPKVPSDLEATVGSHIDTKAPHPHARVFGSLHHTTTKMQGDLGLEGPVGPST